VTPAFVYRALKGLPLQLESEGRASRDFIYVDDIVEGLIRCGTAGSPGNVYNLASGVETTIRELAETINRLCENHARVELLEGREWDRSGRRFGSTEKASRELGFTAKVSLEDGLRATVDWMRDNLELIDACIARHAEHIELPPDLVPQPG
jgi:nucleoside-diphosphate-sugar epimerase